MLELFYKAWSIGLIINDFGVTVRFCWWNVNLQKQPFWSNDKKFRYYVIYWEILKEILMYKFLPEIRVTGHLKSGCDCRTSGK